jgi:hypothetical protein
MKSYLLILAMASLLLTDACTFTTNTNVAVTTNANGNAAAEPTPGAIEAGAAGEDQARTAELVVADLYKAHDGKKTPFFQTKDRARVDKYFTKTLADLIWKDANDSSGEVGAIDFDPLYNGQDIEIKNFAVGKAEVNGDSAVVPVTFTNYGNKQNIKFQMARTNAAWKISDIIYGANENLLKYLKEAYPAGGKKAASLSGVFEGKFRVGETTCTVTPTNTTFNVKWAKGTGVERFLMEDNQTFKSIDDDANRFGFDDSSLDSGTFYRADGKTFKVTRVK